MIANHDRFLAAIRDKNKVSVRYYSPADHGVVDRICAPIEYGPGVDNTDGLNRYWLWDYASLTDSHRMGLLTQQIVYLQVLGVVFDPALLTTEPSSGPVSPAGGLPAATAGSSGGTVGSTL